LSRQGGISSIGAQQWRERRLESAHASLPAEAPVFLPAVLSTLAIAVQQPPATMPPSPVKRIEVQPSTRTITAGDSVWLVARALGADGKPVPDAVLWVQLLGGGGQGP
jgi:hypothetical protein